MAPWVKNLIVMTPVQVAVEVWVQAPVRCNGLKDPALLHLWHWSELQLGFSPWPGNFHVLWKQPFKKKIATKYTAGNLQMAAKIFFLFW